MCLSSVSEEVQALAFHAEQLQLESLRAVGLSYQASELLGFSKASQGITYDQTGYGNM